VKPRTGLFGGTFDPIHVGHLDVARAARKMLGLERVMLIPSHIPPHRAAPRASAAHRFAMAALAVAGEDGLEVSDLEMQSPQPSYTMNTLDRVNARGGVGFGEFVFVTGADAFADVTSWKGYPQLLDRCMFAVVSRPSRSVKDLPGRLPGLASRMVDVDRGGLGAGMPVFLIDAPTAPVSSTDVRERVAAGLSIAGLVPDAVAAHIGKHRLYLESRESHEPV